MNTLKLARAWALCSGLALALIGSDAESGDASSAQHRLVGSSPASVSATTGSTAYGLYVVGGSGQPVGISASANATVVAGGNSTQLPTDRIFRGEFEP